MNIFRQKNAGKLSQLKGERDRLHESGCFNGDDEKKLKKIENEIGRRENREKQYEEKQSLKLAKQSRDNTDNSSHHTEVTANTTVTNNKQIGIVGNSLPVKKQKPKQKSTKRKK